MEEVDGNGHFPYHDRALAFLERADRNESGLTLDDRRCEGKRFGDTTSGVGERKAQRPHIRARTGVCGFEEARALCRGQIFPLAGCRVEAAGAAAVAMRAGP